MNSSIRGRGSRKRKGLNIPQKIRKRTHTVQRRWITKIVSIVVSRRKIVVLTLLLRRKNNNSEGMAIMEHDLMECPLNLWCVDFGTVSHICNMLQGFKEIWRRK